MDGKEIKDEAKEKVEEIKDEAKVKAEEVKEEVKDKVTEVKNEAKEIKDNVKEKVEDGFEQIKTKVKPKKKKRPIRNFFITLLVLIILCVGAVAALVFTGKIKLEYLKSFVKYPRYKMVSNAFENTIDEKALKTDVTANFNIDGLEDEVKDKVKEYQDIAKNTSLEISQVLNDKDELKNLRFKANSMDEDLLDVLANVEDGKVTVAEDKLIEKKYNLKIEQLEDYLKEVNKSLKNSKNASKNLIKLINSSVKMNGEFGQLIDIEKEEDKYILSVNKDLDAKRFIEALDTIENEIREGKPREALENIIENIDINTYNVKNILEGKSKSNKDKSKKAGEFIDNLGEIVKKLKDNEKAEEQINKALKELKKSSVSIKTKAGKIAETEMNVKFEMPNSAYSMGSKNLSLEINLNLKYNYDKKIKKEIEEKLEGEAKDINSEEKLEEEFKNLDLKKILEKIENFKIVKKLNLSDQVKDLKENFVKENKKDEEKEENKDRKDKDKKEDEDRRREREDKREEIGDKNSRFTEKELEEMKKEIRKELEKEYNEKEDKEKQEDKDKEKDKYEMRMR